MFCRPINERPIVEPHPSVRKWYRAYGYFAKVLCFGHFPDMIRLVSCKLSSKANPMIAHIDRHIGRNETRVKQCPVAGPGHIQNHTAGIL